jgi:hypothetical protein
MLNLVGIEDLQFHDSIHVPFKMEAILSEQWRGLHPCQCCQTKARSLRLSEFGCSSGRTYLPPFIQNGSAIVLEIVPAVEVAFLIEVVVDGGVN